VCRSGYYQLQATRHSPDLSTQAVKTLVQAFILYRLDYCNSPFGVGRSTVRPHHSSATAHRWLLASGSTLGGFQDGHHPGLPGSSLLAADCQLVSDEDSRRLRSATSRTSVVKRTYSDYRERYFAAAGPKL